MCLSVCLCDLVSVTEAFVDFHEIRYMRFLFFFHTKLNMRECSENLLSDGRIYPHFSHFLTYFLEIPYRRASRNAVDRLQVS